MRLPAQLNAAVVVVVLFLIVIVVLGFPTRRRAIRAYSPVQGPHPIQRPFLALARWRRARRERRRRNHLRRVDS